VKWSPEKQDEPFFKNRSGRIVRANWFGKKLAEWGHRAGYEQRIKVHDGRREALTKVDGGIPIMPSHIWNCLAEQLTQDMATPRLSE
jgi:hypothetical protein